MTRVSASEVIDVIQDAGGVVSLVHPGRIRADTIDPLVEELAADELDAIEPQYPYADAPDGEYADITVKDAAKLATEHDLLRTGGSDCHGLGSGNFRMGEVRIPQDQLDALRNRAEQRRSL